MAPPPERDKGSMANILSHEKRLSVLAALLDGNSVRATSRMTGVHQDTISRFALAAGQGAQYLHNRLARDLKCHLLEVDEMWTICGSRKAGAVWVWVATDAISKMVITWHAGKRDQENANVFMADVRARLTVMPQISSDGLQTYKSAIGASFGPGVDYGQLVKTWDTSNEESEGRETRGKNKRRKSADKSHEQQETRRDPFLIRRAVFGSPDLKITTTAHVERNNLTMRHMNGRLRRKCLAFSKRPENHAAALSVTYVWANLGRVQRRMKVTPAMAAGITDHIWELDEFLAAIMTAEPCAAPEKQPLTLRVPETTHRELPGGRGFLRVVGGGKATPPHASHAPTSPAMPTPLVATPQQNAPERLLASWAQMDLFAWRPREQQLLLFTDD